MKYDAYQMVTDRICEMLESGIKPWAKPWNAVSDCAWSGQTGRPYSILNQMLLADPEKKYKSIEEFIQDVRGEWLSFGQIQSRGGKIRKGEHGRKVIFFKMVEEKDEDGELTGNKHPYLTTTTVFHIRQCEGISQKYNLCEENDFVEQLDAEAVVADYVDRSKVAVVNCGNRAYYSPSKDTVTIPEQKYFFTSEEYYSTLFHELVHSTGHQSRLNRVNGNVHFGDESYSLEELVAEIGSASLMVTVGIETKDTIANSAAYIDNWLDALRKDKTMIVKAANRAEKAIKMILNIKDGGNEND